MKAQTQTESQPAAHTPLPWATMKSGVNISGNDPFRIQVAQVFGGAGSGDAHANAALIVRAANSHAELVAALGRALKAMEMAAPTVRRLIQVECIAEFEDAQQEARAALAKANA